MFVQKSWAPEWMKRWIGWFEGREAQEESFGIYLDTSVDGVLVHIALGAECEGLGVGAEAALTGVYSLEEVVKVVRFARARRLPVDAWICSGLASAPFHVNELVAWLVQLERLCRPAKLIVRTEDMNERQKTRLLHGLTRRGCRLHPGCAIGQA